MPDNVFIIHVVLALCVGLFVPLAPLRCRCMFSLLRSSTSRVLLDVLLPHVYSCSRAEHLVREAISIVQTYLVRSPCHHWIGRFCRGVIPGAHSPWPLQEATSKVEGRIVNAKAW
jgi:hypothetical protein